MSSASEESWTDFVARADAGASLTPGEWMLYVAFHKNACRIVRRLAQARKQRELADVSLAVFLPAPPHPCCVSPYTPEPAPEPASSGQTPSAAPVS